MVRSLLIAVCLGALSGCGSSPPARPTADVAARLAAVRKGTATTLVAEEPLTVKQWREVAGLEGLCELVVHQGIADDAVAATLARLPRLERLVLRRSPLTDEGFRALAACGSLRDLNVPQAACTAGGIRLLAGLPNLRSLRLGGPHLAGADVGAAVATLRSLRSLHLVDVPIGDEGLEAIARLPQLQSLYLDGAGVSDAAWERYFQSHPHVHVHVDQAHHDRDPGRHD